ncbi:MAG TPA: SHOCT domain-containing protein [Allosphingosinicella sp.]|jgi:hypothetical protein
MDNWIEALEKLAGLKDKGVLTDEEFSAQKAEILRRQHTAPPAPTEEAAGTPSWRTRMRGRPLLLAGVGVAGALVIGALIAWSITTDIQSLKGSGGSADSNSSKTAAADAVVTESTNLDSFIRFAAAQTCAPDGGLATLLRVLSTLPASDSAEVGEPVPLEGLHASLQPLVGQLSPKADGSRVTVAELPLLGTWHSLHVRGIRTAVWQDSGFTSFQIRFAEPVGDVGPVLRRLGFALGGPGRLKYSQAKGEGAVAGIEQQAQGSALTCARGYPSEPAAVAVPASEAQNAGM